MKQLKRKSRVQLYENGWYIKWDRHFRNFELKRMEPSKKKLDKIDKFVELVTLIQS